MRQRSNSTTGSDLGHGTVTGSNPGSAAETVTGQLAVAGATSYTPRVSPPHTACFS